MIQRTESTRTPSLVSLTSAARSRSEGPEKKVTLQPGDLSKEPLSFSQINPRSTLSSKIFAVRSYFTRLDPCAFGF
jgi:hypothetical protein